MAAPVVRADREPVVPVPPGASAIQVVAAKMPVLAVVVQATIGAGEPVGESHLVPVGAGASLAVTSVSRRRVVVV